MNLLKSIFGGKSHKTENMDERNHGIQDQDYQLDIPEDLFIESQAPAEIEQVRSLENRLNLFINKDYFNQGYDMGYNTHSSDILEQMIRKLKSEFILLIDQVIDEKKSLLSELKKHMAEVDGLSDRVYKQLEQKVEDLDSSVSILTGQKSLTVEDEGWIMAPVNVFKLGFIHGLEKYHEVKTFASSTGLFND